MMTLERCLSVIYNSFYFSCVKMVGNTVVHLVARWDTKDSMKIVCMHPIPLSVITLVEYDAQ